MHHVQGHMGVVTIQHEHVPMLRWHSPPSPSLYVIDEMRDPLTNKMFIVHEIFWIFVIAHPSIVVGASWTFFMITKGDQTRGIEFIHAEIDPLPQNVDSLGHVTS